MRSLWIIALMGLSVSSCHGAIIEPKSSDGSPEPSTTSPTTMVSSAAATSQTTTKFAPSKTSPSKSRQPPFRSRFVPLWLPESPRDRDLPWSVRELPESSQERNLPWSVHVHPIRTSTVKPATPYSSKVNPSVFTLSPSDATPAPPSSTPTPYQTPTPLLGGGTQRRREGRTWVTPLGQDPVTNEIVNTFADPTVMIDGISGFLTTVADVFEGIERMTNAAVNMGVSTLVSIQELTENAEVQAGSLKQSYTCNNELSKDRSRA